MNIQAFAGIDIGATNIKFGLIDSSGKILCKGSTPTPSSHPPEKLFEKVVYCGEQLLIEADDQEVAVSQIGVGSPGTVNIKTGVIEGTCPNLPGWIGFHLRDRLSERLNMPVFIDNDANCAALAEHRFGAGVGYDNLICLTIGTGIGGGIIQDGEIFHGSNYAAGEIGHVQVLTNLKGEVKSEILESLVSSRAILGAIKDGMKESGSEILENLIGDDMEQLTIRKMFSAIKRGDKISHEVLVRSAEILGVALTSIVNLVNPELIVIGGGIAEGGREFVDIVRERILRDSVPMATETLTVSPAKLGNDAGFIGAAILGIDNIGEEN